MSSQERKPRKAAPEAAKREDGRRHKVDAPGDSAGQRRDASPDEVGNEPDGLSNADEFPMASVGSASGLQPSGMSPGGSPAEEPSAEPSRQGLTSGSGGDTPRGHSSARSDGAFGNA
jgi:hypothetical protein